MTATFPYRTDIDGLRALAILPVVFFHLGFNGLMGGGYIGVDVFFVISGFLITSIIQRDIKDGCFTLMRFYERRILRILPALFTVAVASAVLGWLTLLPSDFAYFGETLSATAAFSSNILFWMKSGYFAPDSNYIPLLHTWSLSVEEQFYIFFPFILMLLAAAQTKTRVVIIAFIFLLSFIASVCLLTDHKSFTFYMILTRAWELMAGALVALIPLRELKDRRLMEAVSFVGILLICAAIVKFDSKTAFPAASAAIPVAGAALLLYAGSHGTYIVQRILTRNIVLFFGKISYSLYLWHWPLIVYFKYGTPWSLTGWRMAGLFAVCVGLSYLSWRYIEQPARRQRILRGKNLILVTVALCAGFILLGKFIKDTDGLPSRLPPDILKLATPDKDSYPPIAGLTNLGGYQATIGSEKKQASFLVWGDSHANAHIAGIHALARDRKLEGYFLGYRACFPSILQMEDMEDKCNALNGKYSKFLDEKKNIKAVVLIARWSAYYNRLELRRQRGKEEHDLPFDFYLGKTIDALNKAGKKVYILTEVPPAPEQSIRPYIIRQLKYGQESNLSTSLAAYMDEQQNVLKAFKRLEGEHDFTLIEPHKTMCRAGKCPLMGEGQSYYMDDDHISDHGSVRFKDMYLPAFNNM